MFDNHGNSQFRSRSNQDYEKQTTESIRSILAITGTGASKFVI